MFKKTKLSNILFKSFFIVYCLFIIIALYSPIRHTASYVRSIVNGGIDQLPRIINLVPFKLVMTYFTDYNHYQGLGIILPNLIGNILLFIPLGFFIPFIIKSNSFVKNLKYYIPLMLVVETLQIVFLSGIADIDDVIQGIIGCIIGFFIQKVFISFHNKMILKHA